MIIKDRKIKYLLLLTILFFCRLSAEVKNYCIDSIKSIDYSHIWQSYQDEILGYIGDDFQRFRIRFLSIEQDKTDKTKYNVTGKTKVKNIICDFEGIIIVKEVRFYYGDQTCNTGKKKAVLSGSYIFKEDSTRTNSGILEGKFTSYIYWKADNVFFNDLARWYDDSYHNNQFEGKWTNYSSGKSKKCNWGVDRIPDSKELDNGSAEFYPNLKYKNNGWSSYPDGSSDKYEEELKNDRKKWW